MTDIRFLSLLFLAEAVFAFLVVKYVGYRLRKKYKKEQEISYEVHKEDMNALAEKSRLQTLSHYYKVKELEKKGLLNKGTYEKWYTKEEIEAFHKKRDIFKQEESNGRKTGNE